MHSAVWTAQFRRLVMVVFACLFALPCTAARAGAPEYPVRLSEGMLPVIGSWYWHNRELEPQAYKHFLDIAVRHTPYNVLTTSLRVTRRELADAGVHAQIKAAAAYAHARGLKMVMDLDVRLARQAFRHTYPGEQQEMLRLKEVALADKGTVEVSLQPLHLSDHMTGNTTPYIALGGRLVRVYSYVDSKAGIEPDSVRDITNQHCVVKAATAKSVRVAIACNPSTKGRKACVMVAFAHLTPAVFAPHLVSFQNTLVRSYADCRLSGIMKDEWGFPPSRGCLDRNDFWFTRFRAAAYAQRTGGRDLVRDALLLFRPERGRTRQRQAAINHFMAMSWQRNADIENAYYRVAKAVFGPDACVCTHPTWMPYPGIHEFKKNGLNWWAARRDLAQTDESCPFCCRTSLAKKWGSGVCYNQFYATDVNRYRSELWFSVLGGCRVNYHPRYPRPRNDPESGHTALLHGTLMRGECRVRLLPFITRAPLDCPVAVVFGHARAMNWAGPLYKDVGIEVVKALRRAGFPADLIPSSEIASGALKLADDGTVTYGPQRYAAVVLYGPEFEPPTTASFFARAAKGNTALYRVGHWTMDFDAKPFDGAAALPKQMTALPNATECAKALLAHLRTRGIAPQTPNNGLRPAMRGQCRLTDGTEILASGTRKADGDPLNGTFQLAGHKMTVDVIGLVAVRLAADKGLEALAVGGLKHIQIGTFALTLERRADIALWRSPNGKWHGVLQGYHGPVPPALTALTRDWLRLAVPPPLPR